MAAYVGLLRAINLGGSSTLKKDDLVGACVDAGLANVRTYIASGNIVFESSMDAIAAGSAIAGALHKRTGKQIGVVIRSSAQIKTILASNPFAEHPPNKVMALFTDAALPSNPYVGLKGHKDEQLELGEGVIYVFYPNGMGASRLVIAAANEGTARNMNTVAKLVDMVG
jgi:uncharacterized protein (DUF1697 family)